MIVYLHGMYRNYIFQQHAELLEYVKKCAWSSKYTNVARVHLLGKIEAGKSSFVCSTDSVLRGCVSTIAETGEKEQESVTKEVMYNYII